MEKITATKGELVKVAQDLSEKLGLNPPIQTKKIESGKLVDLIKEAISLIDSNEDEELLEYETGRVIVDKMGIVLDERVIKALGAPETEEGDLYSGPGKTETEGGDNAEDVKTVEPVNTVQVNHDDIMVEVQKITKLADLKEYAEGNPIFNKVPVSEYKGLQGVKNLKEAMMNVIMENKNVGTVKEKGKKADKADSVKKPGIIATIVELVEGAGDGISKKEIHEHLITKFPERDSAKMWKTINVQVPSRIRKERFPVVSMKRETETVYKKEA